MKKHKNIIIIVSIVLFAVLLDHFTKYLSILHLPKGNEEMITIIPSFFYLIEHHNEGAAWSLFAGNKFILLVIPVIALIAFFYLVSKGNFVNMKFYTVGLSLMIGGTIGNLIDRIFRGYVIDFLKFYIFSYDYPTFNVADICLVVGTIMFAVDILFLETMRNKENEND